MINKSVSLFLSLFLILNCVLVNLVLSKTLPPSEIEPVPDLYALGSTYQAMNSVNYNASPNPQFSSNNFNNFNEPTPQPQNPIVGNYQNADYTQKPHQTVEKSVVGNYSPVSKIYDFESDLRNTLNSVKDNLGLMADTQRLLVNSFNVQQDHFKDIEKKLEYSPSERHYDSPAGQNYVSPPNQQPIRYQSIPPIPYGQPIIQTPTVHHQKQSHTKTLLKKIIKKKLKRAKNMRSLLSRNVSRSPLEMRAEMALTFIKRGVLNALWTAVIVACVKLVPTILFGIKLMFQSVIPLTGLALFRNNRELFHNHIREIDDDDIDEDKKDLDDEDDDDLDDLDIDIRDDDDKKDDTSGIITSYT